FAKSTFGSISCLSSRPFTRTYECAYTFTSWFCSAKVFFKRCANCQITSGLEVTVRSCFLLRNLCICIGISLLVLASTTLNDVLPLLERNIIRQDILWPSSVHNTLPLINQWRNGNPICTIK